MLRRLHSASVGCSLADDADHRLEPGQLAAILDRAAPILSGEDLDVEIGYEDCQISQFPVESVRATGSSLEFHPGTKHTDCLAKDVCLPNGSGKCGGS